MNFKEIRIQKKDNIYVIESIYEESTERRVFVDSNEPISNDLFSLVEYLKGLVYSLESDLIKNTITSDLDKIKNDQ